MKDYQIHNFFLKIFHCGYFFFFRITLALRKNYRSTGLTGLRTSLFRLRMNLNNLHLLSARHKAPVRRTMGLGFSSPCLCVLVRRQVERPKNPDNPVNPVKEWFDLQKAKLIPIFTK
ncbi:MAG: hypothetical protein C0407_11760 [Desulfobacca sp.]|nr:hypothetical protein [Desulfobacca sp.]